jgi:hypothetical protein
MSEPARLLAVFRKHVVKGLDRKSRQRVSRLDPGVSHLARTTGCALWRNIPAAFRFGYRPRGKAEDYREEALAAQSKLPPDPVGDWYQGGTYCSDEFTNGIESSPV